MTELTTAVTDWLLAVVAAVLGGLLIQAGRTERVAARALWGFSLLGLGVAAAVGGVYHAFRGHFAAETLAAIWKLTIYAAGASTTLFALGAVRASVSRSRRPIFHAALAAEFVLYVAWTWPRDDFFWVVAHSLASFALVLALEIRPLIRHSPEAGWIVSSVVVMLAGAAVQRSGLHLVPGLNHNDLYHLIQIAGAFLAYRGARVVRDAA